MSMVIARVCRNNVSYGLLSQISSKMGAKNSEKAVHLFLPVKTGKKSGPVMVHEQRLHHTKQMLWELPFTVS